MQRATGFAAILITGVIVAFGVRIEAAEEYAVARKHYVEDSHAATKEVARQVQTALRSIYENIRTITFLPSVRQIDRHGTTLGRDGLETIQQIYNNLASSVSVSEVYIVPQDLNPDKIDPATGKPEEPILMFDQLIVHAGRYAKETNPFAASVDDTLGKGSEPEEVEIYEYHQLREQMSWLRQHFPVLRDIDGLNVPVIGGPEVITCDNTQFVHTRIDADRSGMIFSMPFYGPDDRLKGTVSAIILSSALRQLLPSHDYVLVNKAYAYVSLPSKAGQEKRSAKFVGEAKSDPSLIYSETTPLDFYDPISPWVLWAGHSDSAFFEGSEARSISLFEYMGYGVVAGLTLIAICIWGLILRNINLVKANNESLEKRVAERTAEIKHMATHDGLTGLSNRNMLRERIEAELARLRSSESLAVLCLDLDRFKAVNDTLGHPIGDALLRAVAGRLQNCIHGAGSVARIGGDEFVVLLTDLPHADNAASVSQLIIEKIQQPFDIDGHQVNVGASIGVATAPADGLEVDLLLRNADVALYKAKADGRGNYRFFELAMDAQLQARRVLELDLRRALAEEEFVLFYQPQVDAISEQIVGFEALLRWQHPQRGLIAPSEFISLAEEIGLIVPLGDWVLRKACAEAARWPRHIKVAVNLSPVQFKTHNLPHSVVSALASSGLVPSRLELEITEFVLLANTEATLEILHQLRSLGVSIAMDDFGTGYSSLSYLRSFPFDKIKLDRSFVSELAASAGSLAIVKAMSDLGKSFGMVTTAEGVETAAQLAAIREQGCSQVQGFYFSRPVPGSEIAKLLRQRMSIVA